MTRFSGTMHYAPKGNIYKYKQQQNLYIEIWYGTNSEERKWNTKQHYVHSTPNKWQANKHHLCHDLEAK